MLREHTRIAGMDLELLVALPRIPRAARREERAIVATEHPHGAATHESRNGVAKARIGEVADHCGGSSIGHTEGAVAGIS